jgi:hypothetical protein
MQHVQQLFRKFRERVRHSDVCLGFFKVNTVLTWALHIIVLKPDFPINLLIQIPDYFSKISFSKQVENLSEKLS